jgi:type IV secretory pathway component VirB8
VNKPNAKDARRNARDELKQDMSWLREHYGWKAKKQDWATLAWCLLIVATVVAAVVLAQ